VDHTTLRHQMAEVVRAARDALRDETQAARLWGKTADLCDALDCGCDGASPRATMCTALREDIRTGARGTRELVEEIEWFVRAVEHDIEDEEREAIVDDVVSTDQTDG
jgi:hypothetical protein